MRTDVAPKAMAVSKSPLMPMDSFASPLRAAILARRAKCRAGRLVRRRHAHQPLERQAEFGAAGGDEGVGVGRDDAGLLRLLAGVDLDIEPRARGRRAGSPRPGLAASFGRSRRLDHVEEAHGLARLVGLQRADQAQFRPSRRRSSAPIASWTRFSPNIRLAGRSTASIAAHGCCLETATRVTSAGSRPAATRGGGDPGEDRLRAASAGAERSSGRGTCPGCGGRRLL